MLVLTSVIVTVTPGSARPAASTMLPRSSPLMACADAPRACTSSSIAAAHATNQRFVIVPPTEPGPDFTGRMSELYIRSTGSQPADRRGPPIPPTARYSCGPADSQEAGAPGTHGLRDSRPGSK